MLDLAPQPSFVLVLVIMITLAVVMVMITVIVRVSTAMVMIVMVVVAMVIGVVLMPRAVVVRMRVIMGFDVPAAPAPDTVGAVMSFVFLARMAA